MQSNHNTLNELRRNHRRKITTKFQKCNQITTNKICFLPSRGAKLPQNFKNAIKSQPCCSSIGCFKAQNYHKISKMQSNHNSFPLVKTINKRKITTKFQKCNQITTVSSITIFCKERKITTKFQKCNQITTEQIGPS